MCMFSIQGDARQCTSDGDMSQSSNRSTCVDLRATVCYAMGGFVGGVDVPTSINVAYGCVEGARYTERAIYQGRLLNKS